MCEYFMLTLPHIYCSMYFSANILYICDGNEELILKHKKLIK